MTRKFILLMLSLFLLWIAGFGLYCSYFMNMKPYAGNAEGIVVLTGGDGRVEAGLRLLDKERAPRLLISGVHRDVKLDDLLHVHKSKTAFRDRIDLGFAAIDTLGNADETASWVEKHNIQSLIIVTAHYHMPRALLHLGNQLPDVAMYPYPVVPDLFKNKEWYKDKMDLYLVFRDYNKFLLTYPQIFLFKRY